MGLCHAVHQGQGHGVQRSMQPLASAVSPCDHCYHLLQPSS